MNLMVFLVGAIGYYLIGFALQFGGVGSWGSLGIGPSALNSEFVIPGFGGLFGMKGFGLSTGGVYDVGIYALFFFQMVFMDTTCTIPTGGMAERVKFSSVVVMAAFVSMIYYPLYGNWVWGGGWLATLGANFGLGHGVVDFAGSSVRSRDGRRHGARRRDCSWPAHWQIQKERLGCRCSRARHPHGCHRHDPSLFLLVRV